MRAINCITLISACLEGIAAQAFGSNVIPYRRGRISITCPGEVSMGIVSSNGRNVPVCDPNATPATFFFDNSFNHGGAISTSEIKAYGALAIVAYGSALNGNTGIYMSSFYEFGGNSDPDGTKSVYFTDYTGGEGARYLTIDQSFLFYLQPDGRYKIQSVQRNNEQLHDGPDTGYWRIDPATNQIISPIAYGPSDAALFQVHLAPANADYPSSPTQDLSPEQQPSQIGRFNFHLPDIDQYLSYSADEYVLSSTKTNFEFRASTLRAGQYTLFDVDNQMFASIKASGLEASSVEVDGLTNFLVLPLGSGSYSLYSQFNGGHFLTRQAGSGIAKRQQSDTLTPTGEDVDSSNAVFVAAPAAASIFSSATASTLTQSQSTMPSSTEGSMTISGSSSASDSSPIASILTSTELSASAAETTSATDTSASEVSLPVDATITSAPTVIDSASLPGSSALSDATTTSADDVSATVFLLSSASIQSLAEDTLITSLPPTGTSTTAGEVLPSSSSFQTSTSAETTSSDDLAATAFEAIHTSRLPTSDSTSSTESEATSWIAAVTSPSSAFESSSPEETSAASTQIGSAFELPASQTSFPELSETSTLTIAIDPIGTRSFALAGSADTIAAATSLSTATEPSTSEEMSTAVTQISSFELPVSQSSSSASEITAMTAAIEPAMATSSSALAFLASSLSSDESSTTVSQESAVSPSNAVEINSSADAVIIESLTATETLSTSISLQASALPESNTSVETFATTPQASLETQDTSITDAIDSYGSSTTAPDTFMSSTSGASSPADMHTSALEASSTSPEVVQMTTTSAVASGLSTSTVSIDVFSSPTAALSSIFVAQPGTSTESTPSVEFASSDANFGSDTETRVAAAPSIPAETSASASSSVTATSATVSVLLTEIITTVQTTIPFVSSTIFFTTESESMSLIDAQGPTATTETDLFSEPVTRAQSDSGQYPTSASDSSIATTVANESLSSTLLSSIEDEASGSPSTSDVLLTTATESAPSSITASLDMSVFPSRTGVFFPTVPVPSSDTATSSPRLTTASTATAAMAERSSGASDEAGSAAESLPIAATDMMATPSFVNSASITSPDSLVDSVLVSSFEGPVLTWITKDEVRSTTTGPNDSPSVTSTAMVEFASSTLSLDSIWPSASTTFMPASTATLIAILSSGTSSLAGGAQISSMDGDAPATGTKAEPSSSTDVVSKNSALGKLSMATSTSSVMRESSPMPDKSATMFGETQTEESSSDVTATATALVPSSTLDGDSILVSVTATSSVHLTIPSTTAATTTVAFLPLVSTSDVVLTSSIPLMQESQLLASIAEQTSLATEASLPRLSLSIVVASDSDLVPSSLPTLSSVFPSFLAPSISEGEPQSTLSAALSSATYTEPSSTLTTADVSPAPATVTGDQVSSSFFVSTSSDGLFPPSSYFGTSVSTVDSPGKPTSSSPIIASITTIDTTPSFSAESQLSISLSFASNSFERLGTPSATASAPQQTSDLSAPTSRTFLLATEPDSVTKTVSAFICEDGHFLFRELLSGQQPSLVAIDQGGLLSCGGSTAFLKQTGSFYAVNLVSSMQTSMADLLPVYFSIDEGRLVPRLDFNSLAKRSSSIYRTGTDAEKTVIVYQAGNQDPNIQLIPTVTVQDVTGVTSPQISSSSVIDSEPTSTSLSNGILATVSATSTFQTSAPDWRTFTSHARVSESLATTGRFSSETTSSSTGSTRSAGPVETLDPSESTANSGEPPILPGSSTLTEVASRSVSMASLLNTAESLPATIIGVSVTNTAPVSLSADSSIVLTTTNEGGFNNLASSAPPQLNSQTLSATPSEPSSAFTSSSVARTTAKVEITRPSPAVILNLRYLGFPLVCSDGRIKTVADPEARPDGIVIDSTGTLLCDNQQTAFVKRKSNSSAYDIILVSLPVSDDTLPIGNFAFDRSSGVLALLAPLILRKRQMSASFPVGVADGVLIAGPGVSAAGLQITMVEALSSSSSSSLRSPLLKPATPATVSAPVSKTIASRFDTVSSTAATIEAVGLSPGASPAGTVTKFITVSATRNNVVETLVVTQVVVDFISSDSGAGGIALINVSIGDTIVQVPVIGMPSLSVSDQSNHDDLVSNSIPIIVTRIMVVIPVVAQSGTEGNTQLTTVQALVTQTIVGPSSMDAAVSRPILTMTQVEVSRLTVTALHAISMHASSTSDASIQPEHTAERPSPTNKLLTNQLPSPTLTLNTSTRAAYESASTLPRERSSGKMSSPPAFYLLAVIFALVAFR